MLFIFQSYYFDHSLNSIFYVPIKKIEKEKRMMNQLNTVSNIKYYPSTILSESNIKELPVFKQPPKLIIEGGHGVTFLFLL